MTSRAHDLELISALERLELPIVTWGIVDAALSEDEVRAAIEEYLDAASDFTTTPAEVLERLERQALIVRVSNDPARFRTRFAESVRLFARLRQLFPQHLQRQTWRGAPELVVDFRVASRPRRFPRRDRDGTAEVEAALELLPAAERDFSRAVLLRLLRDDTGDARFLAQFQGDSLRHILRVVGQQRTTASIITAGTGSGKTLAFYLPALLDAARHVDESAWTKVVAIYPRVELLKDQLAEAVGHAVHLRDLMTAQRDRPLRIGAFFGNTPYNARDRLEIRGWRRFAGDAYLCPFVLCWECGGQTLWTAAARNAGREVLRCRNCGVESVEGDLAFTRDGMRERPPDVLFTTTEMINRHLSSPEYGHIFGVHRRARPPRLALIDEAHTYEGNTGAQTAYLFRRWRSAVGEPLQMVGLSATLEEPQAFFGRLVGISEGDVALIAPRDEDLQDAGAEYMLALRGNPMSGTALLSTTIQALMLLRRIEDVDLTTPSGGAFPPRVFAFTDNLDVTNRLYDNLLEAEGRTDRNRPRAASLAALRRPAPPDAEARRRDGQVWDLCLQIGHSLAGSPLSISRTSSRDSGVDESSDIVVATPSLEVGYDDVRVGSTLQHKAPRDAASFVQRRGRAGRRQIARPWSVVVLSDFGRDRRAYQGFESLFDPVVRPNALPIANGHIIKVQGAYVLLDWLSHQIRPAEGTLWTALAGPAANNAWGVDVRRIQQRAVLALRALLTDLGVADKFAIHLSRTLSISKDETAAVLWENPRSLMLDAAPTLLRRLETNWRSVRPLSESDRFARSPLPEFVPATLFGELNTPEVELVLASGAPGISDAAESVPIVQALRELTPGRVTRRFSRQDQTRTRHWVPLPLPGSQDVELATFVTDGAEIGQVTFTEGHSSVTVPCVRPWSARLEVPNQTVRDSQDGRLSWRVDISSRDNAIELDLPARHAWQAVLHRIDFFTHRSRTEVDIRRYSAGGEASDPANADRTRIFRFVRDQQGSPARVAVGFDGTYDAIRLLVTTPARWVLPVEGERALRRRHFDMLVTESTLLAEHASFFSRSWLATLYRSAVTATAAANGLSGVAARDLVATAGVGRSLERAMRVVFEVSSGDAVAAGGAPDTRAEQRLVGLFRNPTVTDELHRLGETLVTTGQPAKAFVRQLFHTTVAAAFKDALSSLAPTVNADELLIDVVDVSAAGGEGDAELWLCEPSVGGGGAVEHVLAAATADTPRFLSLAENAVGPSPYEGVHDDVTAILRGAESHEPLRQALADYRAADSAITARQSLLAIERVVGAFGGRWSRAAASTLANRVLRPGSSPATDRMTLDLHERWEAIERLTGFDADARVVAYALRDDLDVATAVGVVAPVGQEEPWRFSQIYGLIWPRGVEARIAQLDAYTPFANLPAPERLIVAPFLTTRYEEIPFPSENWRDSLHRLLRRDGVAQLVADRTERAAIKQALLSLASEPVDLGYIHAYGRVTGIAAHGNVLDITVRLDEAF